MEMMNRAIEDAAVTREFFRKITQAVPTREDAGEPFDVMRRGSLSDRSRGLPGNRAERRRAAKAGAPTDRD